MLASSRMPDRYVPVRKSVENKFTENISNFSGGELVLDRTGKQSSSPSLVLTRRIWFYFSLLNQILSIYQNNKHRFFDPTNIKLFGILHTTTILNLFFMRILILCIFNWQQYFVWEIDYCKPQLCMVISTILLLFWPMSLSIHQFFWLIVRWVVDLPR